MLSLLCLVRSHRCFSKLRLLFCVTYICLVCTISYFKTITAYTSRMLCHSLLPLHCQLTVEVLQSHTMYNNRTSKLHIVHACIAHAVACLLHATCMSCSATPCSGMFAACYTYVMRCYPLQCAVPYLKVKLDRLFSVLQEEDDQLSIGWWSGSLKYSYFSLYPYLSALWQVLSP